MVMVCMCLQWFAENLQIKKAKTILCMCRRETRKGSLFAFLEVAKTLQTADGGGWKQGVDYTWWLITSNSHHMFSQIRLWQS